MPFLRDMEVTRVLVRGKRTEIWPGRWAGDLLSWEIQVTLVYTRTQGISASTTSPPTPYGLHGKAKRDPNTQGDTGKSPHRKSATIISGLCVLPVVPRLKNIWWDLPMTNQTIESFPELPRPPPDGTGGPSGPRRSPPSWWQCQLGQGLGIWHM